MRQVKKSGGRQFANGYQETERVVIKESFERGETPGRRRPSRDRQNSRSTEACGLMRSRQIHIKNRAVIGITDKIVKLC